MQVLATLDIITHVATCVNDQPVDVCRLLPDNTSLVCKYLFL